MAGARDSLIDLERHKRALEDNISQLQRSLRHWQTWDAEYEALKEELASASDPTALQQIQTDFDGELVKGKELTDIFGTDGQRSAAQVTNILDRRIDYVTKNIETLQKQLLTAENKLAAAMVVSQPDAHDEDGQPITEIIEELDDDDNVVSYSLNRPGESLTHIQEALKKVGVTDLPELKEESPTPASAPGTSDEADRSLPTKSRRDVQEPSKKKAVSFAEETSVAAPTYDNTESQQPISRAAVRVQKIMDSAKVQEELIGQDPVIPDDEDPEDAAMRKEMLQYSMGEVGAVVAELQLEEGDVDDDDYEFEYTDEEMEAEDDDEDEGFDEEDKYGRYKGRVVTDDYRARMLELEKKLGVKSRFTMKEEERQAAVDDGDDDESGSDDERIGRIVVNHQAEPSPSSKAASAPSTKAGNEADKKKGVRFADKLDVANEEEPVTASSNLKERESVVEPLSDIVERSSVSKPVVAKPGRTASRFKSARAESSVPSQPARNPADIPASFYGQGRQTAPTGPADMTIADTLVEREPSSSIVEDDGYDDYSEIALEHQRLRKKFINEQGGFLKKDDRSIVPLDEAEEGPVRQSRFKAARHSRQ